MSLDKLKKTFRSYKRLLESDTLGSFDFFTCIICLDSIDSAGLGNYLEALTTKNYLAQCKLAPLAAHEFTHFIDSTSTVWGMNHLNKMNEAYCANNAMGGSEQEFYKAKSFLEHARSLRLPAYYTLIDETKRGIGVRYPLEAQAWIEQFVHQMAVLISLHRKSDGLAYACSRLR